MEAIVNGNIKILGINTEMELIDFSMEVVPNKHGYAKVKIRILDGGNGREILNDCLNKIITIKSDAADNEGIIFKGYISDCFVTKTQIDEIVEFELITTTVELDKKRMNKSYQKISDTYEDVIKDTLSEDSGVYETEDKVLLNKGIKKPIIRYKETSWEFVKRLASRHNASVTADVTTDKPTIIFGTAKKNNISEKNFSTKTYVKIVKVGDYLSRYYNDEEAKVKLDDFNKYILKSYGNYQIGDTVTYKGNNMTIIGKVARMEGGQLTFEYEVGNDRVNGVQTTYNKLLKGRTLEGKVVKAEKEKLKVQLDIDREKKSEAELYEFPWTPDTGNFMYAMPEEGSVVCLYIGGCDEGDAVVINTLYKEEQKDRSNPDERYFTTKEKKRMFLKKKEMGFSAEDKDDGKDRITIKDDFIELKTDGDIVLQADKDIIFAAKDVKVDGKKAIELTQNKIGIDIKKKIKVLSKKVKLGIGFGVPSEPCKAAKLQLRKITEPQTKIKNTGCSVSGAKLEGYLEEVNNKFRGDQFGFSGSFNASISARKRQELVGNNINMTCELGENLDGHITSNDLFQQNVSDADKERLSALRQSISPIKDDTVMQKVVPKGAVDFYFTVPQEGGVKIGGCNAKAADAAPYTTNAKEVYGNLRLDYEGEEKVKEDGSVEYTGGRMYKNLADTDGKVNVIRFTSSFCPDNTSFPNRNTGNSAPCTETGFAGSDNCLIPETLYDRSPITDGAIYEIDKDGNESMVAVWDKDMNQFIKVE
ncbi:MAG: hypothetical protein IJD58_12625 [Lachnospiraceae bacterium]|nr:hypothetical protein [Lachnospiraceae bacterium]